MRAVTITRHGDPSVLEVRELADLEPKGREIRVAVQAAGLNFADVSARQGLYPDAPRPPCVVGYEVAGIIDRVGPEVTGRRVGERVLAMTRFRGQASQVIVPESFAFPIPDAMSFAEGAAIPVNYLTAHHMLFYLGTVHPGSRVLLHMAAGGVGTAVFQLLSTVPEVVTFGTASAAKHDYLRKLGCTHPIDYRNRDYVQEVRRLTEDRGVDLILDPMGGAEWKKGWSLLAPTGRMVAFGFAAAHSGMTRNLIHVLTQVVQMPWITPLKVMDENKTLQGCNIGHLWDQAQILRPQIARLIELFDRGVVKPHIDAEVSFDQAAEAHLRIEQRRNMGKVILVP